MLTDIQLNEQHHGIMERLVTSSLKLGIIAGGQLGKMLIQEASKWDIITYVLDNDENCPARSIASKYVKGNHLNFDDVYNFGKIGRASCRERV